MNQESELSKFQQCLINLKWIFGEMYEDYQESKKLETDNRNYIVYKVSKFGFIQVCSYLEELDILNRISIENEHLRDTLYVCAPVIRNLRKYNGLKKMRNLMLAHVNRDKMGNFKPWWTELKGLRKPNTEKDIDEIFESLAFIDDMLRLRHKDDWNKVIPYLKISVQQYMNEDKHDHFIKVKQEKSMKEINEEVLKRMKEKNISPLLRKK